MQCRKSLRRNDGFTLVELMLVVQIISILAVIGIPQLQRAMMTAREGSAVGSMRQIARAQVQFKDAGFVDISNDGAGDYGTLAQLADPDGLGATPGFLEEDLEDGNKSGYNFFVNVVPGGPAAAPSYQCFAVPSQPGVTGFAMYFVDETGVVRFTNDGTLPGPASRPI